MTCRWGGQGFWGWLGFVGVGYGVAETKSLTLIWRSGARVWLPLALAYFQSQGAQPSDHDAPWEARTRSDSLGQDGKKNQIGLLIGKLGVNCNKTLDFLSLEGIVLEVNDDVFGGDF